MIYVNKGTGEVLTRSQMKRQFFQMYDGGAPTNPLGWNEYYDELPDATLPEPPEETPAQEPSEPEPQQEQVPDTEKPETKGEATDEADN